MPGEDSAGAPLRPHGFGVRGWAAIAALVVTFVCQVYAFHDVRYDDAFITYRYGQNLAAGHGLTFNPGERFLGSTSPAHMLIAAVVHALAGRAATPSIMSALGCLGWSAQAVAVYFLLQRSLGVTGAAIVAAAIALGAAGSFMWVSLETNLVTALSLWALVAAQRARWMATAVLAALACLMRPDAAILALVLGGACVVHVRARALWPACAFVAIVLPWIVFAWLYYGSVIPHSAVEKFQRSELTVYFAHTLRVLRGALLPLVDSLAWSVAIAGVLAAGAFLLLRRDRFLRVVALYAALHWIAYLALRPFAAHNWHLYPLACIVVVLALSGLAAAALHVGPRLRWAAAAGLAALVLAGAARTIDAARTHDDAFWSGSRDAAYRQVARELVARARPGDEFASLEVGTLAYYSDLPAYDLGGLVTDLKSTRMLDRNVRWLVLDRQHLRFAPRWAPVFTTSDERFEVFVFHLPRPERR